MLVCFIYSCGKSWNIFYIFFSGISVSSKIEKSDEYKEKSKDNREMLTIAVVPDMDSNPKSAKKMTEATTLEIELKRAPNNSNKSPNLKTLKNSEKSTRSKKENRPKNSTRYDGRNHLPKFDSYDYATRCKNDDCNFKTNVICTKCNVHLCFTRSRNCFENFHFLELEQDCINPNTLE